MKKLIWLRINVIPERGEKKMVSIRDGPNRYYVYGLSALSTDALSTSFPAILSNGTINILGDGSTCFFKDTKKLSVYDKETNLRR